MNEEVEKTTIESPKTRINLFYVVLGLIIVSSTLYVVYGRGKTKTPTNQIVTEVSKIITLEEVANHNSKVSCWTVINGEVYDVTNFISKHKGGDKILSSCGIDATDLFTGKSSLGRVHSKVATSLLSSMKIGTLQK